MTLLAPTKVGTKKQRAFIVDLDGTVAINDGHRGHFDWTLVKHDRPNGPVVTVVRALSMYAGLVPLFVSGREDVCFQDSLWWIREHVYAFADPDHLFMRPAGNFDDDTIIKKRIYLDHIEPNYDVEFCLDDRNKVVSMFRDELGLTVFQVAPGDF